jgi:hypothetical protein
VFSETNAIYALQRYATRFYPRVQGGRFAVSLCRLTASSNEMWSPYCLNKQEEYDFRLQKVASAPITTQHAAQFAKCRNTALPVPFAKGVPAGRPPRAVLAALGLHSPAFDFRYSGRCFVRRYQGPKAERGGKKSTVYKAIVTIVTEEVPVPYLRDERGARGLATEAFRVHSQRVQ